MKYKIIKRIQDGQVTVGYQLLSDDGKVLNIPKNEVLQAANTGMIVNAVFNNRTKALSGVNGLDLRSLQVIQYSTLINNTNTDKSTKNEDKVAKNAVKTQETESAKNNNIKSSNDNQSTDKKIVSADNIICDNIEKALSNLLKRHGLGDVIVESVGRNPDNIREFKLVAKNNPYKFYIGYLVLSVSSSWNFNGKHKSMYVNLSNMENAFTFGTYEVRRILKTAEYNISDGVEMVDPSDYGVNYSTYCHSYDTYKLANIYKGKLYSIVANRPGGINIGFIDAKYLPKLINNALYALESYIESKKKTIYKYLYQDAHKDILPIDKIPYKRVCTTDGHTIANARDLIEKAFDLEKQGYRIVVNGQIMTAEQFNKKPGEDSKKMGGGHVYSCVEEYVDTANKTLYCKLGKMVRYA